jgi:alkanesulfonate monooxygenase SsuD/methylene tetrahydromethanopterin reductase-like flavin-dependent oxidoreductase (luciferase family)
MEVFAFWNLLTDGEALAGKVRKWEEIGLAGVLVPDHFFVAGDGPRTAATVQPDPYTVLPAIGAMSSYLQVGTIVANCNLVHPGWILRHLTQMAWLYGGDRVMAGFGAGWNTEEFDALGLTMPLYPERLSRLEETLEVATQVFADGRANFSGRSFSVRDLPMSTGGRGAPRLLVGGGSERLLDLAARYADYVDLSGSPRGLKLRRSGALQQDGLRRLSTTTDDLEAVGHHLDAILDHAGKEPASLRRSVLLDTVDICEQGEVSTRRAAVAEARRGDESWVGNCPYVLVGPPEHVAEVLSERIDRLGLSALIVWDSPHLETLMREVLPLLDGR